jgi:type VI secretion system protein ImpH
MDRASSEILPVESLSPASLDQLQAKPWRYGFLPFMRRLNANAAIEPIGTARLPSTETFRLGQKPSLLFAPREIAEATVERGRLHIRLFGLGMLGPNGPLPLHVTEIAREREEQRQDATLCNFLDVFHHRSFSLLYRAWAQAQSTASLDRAEHDRFSFHVTSLAGYARRRAPSWPMPEHARRSAAPHLIRQSRSTDGLQDSLAHYFGVSALLVEYDLHWMKIQAQRQCIMGGDQMSLCLAMGATLGERIPDRQCRFRIVLGPLDIESYQLFTPQGTDLLQLIDCVRAFVGKEFSWELELLIQPESATPAQIGGTQQLGWSSWMGESPVNKPITGMLFEPEQYLQQLRRRAAARLRTSATESAATPRFVPSETIDRS